jgi:tRNA dimethylallyltransferase
MGAEIISVDSMKVYRRMDIGTAKPPAEVLREVPHHLIDVVDPWEDFSVARFVELAEAAIQDIHSRGKPILVVGGTPLYVKALSEGLFEGPGADPNIRSRLESTARERGTAALHESLRRIDPKAADRIHPNDLRRLIRALEVHELTGTPISDLQAQWDRDRKKYECVFLGIRREKEELHQRINERVRRMIAQGLVNEVRELLTLPQPLSTAARQALGYAEVIAHLTGGFSLDDAVEMIKINTRQLAKAQRTWFKRFREIEWIDVTAEQTAERVANELIGRRGSLWSA